MLNAPPCVRGAHQFIRHPRVVVEALSPKTVDYDQGDKFGMYRALTSLGTYALIATDRVSVEVRSRLVDGTWQVATLGPGDEVVLPTIGCHCPSASFYENTSMK